MTAWLLLPWLTSQIPYLATVVRSSPELVPAMLVSTLSTPIAATVLVLTAVVSDRHRFIPRAAA